MSDFIPQKCLGCNKKSILLFSWLAGQNYCNECLGRFKKRTKNALCLGCGTSVNVFFSGRCTKCNELYLKGEMESQRTLTEEKNIQRFDEQKSAQVADKILIHSKTVISMIFGAIALLYFIVMIPAQPDFQAIVIGWVIIGGVYLLLIMFTRFKL